MRGKTASRFVVDFSKPPRTLVSVGAWESRSSASACFETWFGTSDVFYIAPPVVVSIFVTRTGRDVGEFQSQRRPNDTL
jgi:hypothetical protein